ncbi:MAG: hypothetical protein E3J56_11730 [Candidatus Aminicenantes bacterium]|nr:MAG: hypothetical protein E3J56_11730 [Candidatus Aminicenantes bacterium]
MNKKSKIKEAEYFLVRMKAEQDNKEQFEFNLSAFLSAARSVLQYAFEEVKKARTREMKWYENSVSGSPIIGFSKDKRDNNIHIEPVKPQADYSHEASAVIEFSGSSEDEVRDKNGKVVAQGSSEKPTKKSEKPKTSAVDEVKYKFRDWPGNEDVLTLCERYIQELEKVVQDGVSKGYITG